MTGDKRFCPFVLLANRLYAQGKNDDVCRGAACGIWNPDENCCGFSFGPESPSLVAMKSRLDDISKNLGNNLDIKA